MNAPLEIIAHRGASYLAPENTLSAFRLGWDEGADAVEGDFRITRDGRIIAIHDDSLKRTAGTDSLVSESMLADLEMLDVGCWKDASFGGERIATLDACLATTPPGKRFFVEIKSGPQIVPELVRVVRASREPQRQVVIISLLPDVVAAAKQALTDVKVFFVVQFRQDEHSGKWSPTIDELLAFAKQARLDGLDLMARGPIDATMTAAFRDAGLDLCAWTVDEPELARRLIDLGVSGITTNRPGWLREQLGIPQ